MQFRLFRCIFQGIPTRLIRCIGGGVQFPRRSDKHKGAEVCGMIQKLTKATTRLLAILFAMFATTGAWADFAKTNPVTGATENYTWKFVGTDMWNGTQYWKDSDDNNPSGDGVPAKTSGGDIWEPILFDNNDPGNTININASMSVEGWNLRMGLYNGANITLQRLVKLQSGVATWFTVDESSTLTIAGMDNNKLEGSNPLCLYSARANGITWTPALSNSAIGTGVQMPIYYYLAGDGTVAFNGGITLTSAQVIKQADVTLSGAVGLKKVYSKTLVSFASSSTSTFSADATINVKNSLSEVVRTVNLSSINTTGETTLTTSDPVGDCELVQTSTGIYLYWVDNSNEIEWTGLGGDNLWSNSQNWSPEIVPTASETVVFGTGTYEVGIASASSTVEVAAIAVASGGKVTFRHNTSDYNSWPSIKVCSGHITGSGGTVVLKRCGLKGNAQSPSLVVDCNLEFLNDGSNSVNHDSWIEGATFTINGSVSGSGLLKIDANATFNGTVTLGGGAYLQLNNIPSFGGSSRLVGTESGTIILTTLTGIDNIKTKLKNSDWEGVCELRNTGSDSTAIDAANYGNKKSTVRFNGMTGYLRYPSSGSVADVGEVKCIDLVGNGLSLVNKFSNGTYGYRITAELTGDGPFKVGTQHSGGTYGAGTYIITGSTANFTGAVNHGSTTSYRAVVVFATDAEYSAGTIPIPTDHGQIIVTAGRTGEMAVTAGSLWNGHGGFIINGTLNVGSGGSLSTDSNGKKVQGSGTINYQVLPTAGNPSTTTIPLFSDLWTGTVILPATTLSVKTGIPLIGLSSPNGRIVVKGFTRSADDLSIHLNSGTATIKGTLQLDGNLYITDGNGSANYTWNKVTGSGNMTVTKAAGSASGIVHAITTLDDYKGTLETKTFSLTIGTVNLPSLDLTVGDPIVKLATGCNLTTDPANIAVKVGNEATEHKLYKASDGHLYIKVASVTVNATTTYYPTLQAAADAAMAAGGETIQFTRIDSEAATSLPGWSYEDGVFTFNEAYNVTTATEYAKLSDAVAAASAGDTIKIMRANSEDAVDTTGKDFIFDENGYAFNGTWTGSGRIVLSAAPSTTTWSSASFVADGWTGTVALNWANIVSANDLAGEVNKYGIAASTVEVGPSGSASGYLNSALTPKFKVNGEVEVKNGSSNDANQRDMGTVSGSGKLKFTTHNGGYGETTNYKITSLDDWDGKLTVTSTNVKIVNINSGSGGVEFTVTPQATPTFASTWRGAFVMNWTVSQTSSTAWVLDNYGVSGSTVVVAKPIEHGYFKDKSSDTAPSIAPAVYLKANVTVDNGFYNVTTTFSQLGADAGIVFTTRSSGDGTPYAVTLLKDFDGSFNLLYGSRLTIDTIERSALPDAGDLVVSATAQTGTSTPASFNVASTKIRVGGIDTVVPLAYSTSVAVDESGLYKAVAQISTAYYATMQEAITAAGDANLANITVLDSSAAMPDGYYIDNGVVAKCPAAIVYDVGDPDYYNTVQAAVNAANAKTYAGDPYEYVAVYANAAVTTAMTLKIKPMNEAVVTVSVPGITSEYALNDETDGNGVVTYTIDPASTDYTWVTGSGVWDTTAVAPWRYDVESTPTQATRAPGSVDSVAFASAADVTVGANVSVSSMTVSSAITLTKSTADVTVTATTGGIVLTDAGASISVTGVTFSPTPTTNVARSRVKTVTEDGATTYSVELIPGTTFTVY